MADYAEASIAAGSKSFAAASRLMPRAMRRDVWRLYAWCRHCDDVVDGQTMGHGQRRVADAAARLGALRAATDAALAGRTAAPAFAGFAEVAARHSIPAALVHDHLDGFAMDVAGRTFRDETELAAYCYGVAGSVGVMMALVMGVAPDDADTLDRACDLGLAFQMTNIARDVVADARVGRLYLPTDWLAAARVAPAAAAIAEARNAAAVHGVAARLVATAEPYYASARVGIGRLPFRAAWAIAAAMSVYRAIGTKRAAGGPQRLAERVGTTRTGKAVRIAGALYRARADRAGAAPPRTGLWTRPRRAMAEAARAAE